MATILSSYDRRVYKWESEWVHPHDPCVTTERETRGLVPYVWEREGLLHPPKVIVKPGMRGGLGNRTEVTVGDPTRLSVILHELAHSMDVSVEMSLLEGRHSTETMTGSFHDANWLGLYIKLLDRYIGGRHFNQLWLWKTANDAGLEFSVAARPRCI